MIPAPKGPSRCPPAEHYKLNSKDRVWSSLSSILCSKKAGNPRHSISKITRYQFLSVLKVARETTYGHACSTADDTTTCRGRRNTQGFVKIPNHRTEEDHNVRIFVTRAGRLKVGRRGKGEAETYTLESIVPSNSPLAASTAPEP